MKFLIAMLFTVVMTSSCGLLFLDWGDASECLLEGTMIETENGSRPIEDMEIGDKILSYNFARGETIIGVVVAREVHENRNDLYELQLADGRTLKATADHKFYIGNGEQYKRVEDVAVGESFYVLSEEGLSPVVLIGKTKIDNNLPVYNLAVQGDEGEDVYFAEKTMTTDY